jgi:Flp pilus assembly protein TadG
MIACRRTAMRMRFTAFTRDDDGAATIEAVLWIPFFLTLFMALADISMIFNGQSRLQRIVQDANRNLSIGRLRTEADTEAFILSRAQPIAPHATAHTTVTAGLITSSLSVPIEDLDVVGVVAAFRGSSLTVRSDHLMEN